MAHITIKVPVPEGREAFWLERMMMVTPVNSSELMALAKSLEELEGYLRKLRQRHATLRQAFETKDGLEPDTAKALALLIEASELHARKVEFVRTLLGSSELTTILPTDKGNLQ